MARIFRDLLQRRRREECRMGHLTATHLCDLVPPKTAPWIASARSGGLHHRPPHSCPPSAFAVFHRADQLPRTQRMAVHHLRSPNTQHRCGQSGAVDGLTAQEQPHRPPLLPLPNRLCPHQRPRNVAPHPGLNRQLSWRAGAVALPPTIPPRHDFP